MDITVVIAFVALIVLVIAFFRIVRFSSAKLGQRVRGVTGENGSLIVYEKGVFISKYKVEILFSDIVAIGSNSFSSTETKERSVIGRAVVGNALFGSTGAIVGGMSGLKDKKVNHYSEYVIIETKNKKYIFESNEYAGGIIETIKSKLAK